eukprot:TRINITY_DN2248_c0_g4_i2.p2 TRINITY_DN2248_c0_g4~~TRINITY_DN2248_c0_g4_i2.p2  ORF type:complete len:104 (+),score=10.65 TRINITY_DN2248_c0_g4_i2:154-465(+)
MIVIIIPPKGEFYLFLPMVTQCAFECVMRLMRSLEALQILQWGTKASKCNQEINQGKPKLYFSKKSVVNFCNKTKIHTKSNQFCSNNEVVQFFKIFKGLEAFL